MAFNENRFVASVNDRLPGSFASRIEQSHVLEESGRIAQSPLVSGPRCSGRYFRFVLKNPLMVFGIAALATLIAGTVTSMAEDSSTKPASTKNKKVAEKPKATSEAEGQEKEQKPNKDDSVEIKRPPKIVKTEAEWKKLLKPEQFRVTRLKETELAFSGKYWHNKKPGKYLCVCCGEELYSSTEKFESGTGWPSFWAPVSEQAIGTETDNSLETVRTEVHCDRCGAHLGHIFDDGPAPTGMRHCINSASLKFVPAETAKTK